MLRVLPHGGGVQTSVQALMHACGELPPIDAAIFADTQQEPRAMYEQLAWVEREVARSKHPFPFYHVTRGDLWKSATLVRTRRDGLKKYIKTAIPLFFLGEDDSEGRGMRSCTRDFKIDAVTSKIRELLGRRRRRIKPEEGILATVLLGFTVDEASRMKPNAEPWIENRYALIEANMSRADCYHWAERKGYPQLVGSACKFCPNRTDWAALDDDEFMECIAREREIQGAYAQIGFKAVPYFHESRVPLSQIRRDPGRRRRMAEQQMNMFINQCEGGCGV